MSYLADLWSAIRTRALADTGTGGLFNASSPLVSGIWNNEAPNNTSLASLPLLVYDTLDAANVDAFRTSNYRVQWRVTTYCERANDGIADTAARCAAIQARILGDWTAQTYGTGPTYGFDRWQPSLSPWSATVCQHLRSGTAHTLEMWQFFEEFEVWVSRAGA